MNEFQESVLDGFEAHLDMLRDADPDACNFHWPVTNGKDYDGIPGSTPDALSLVAGGFLEDYQTSITCRRWDFKTLPTSKDRAVFGGRVVRIMRVNGSAVSPLVVFDLSTPDK